MARDFPLPTLKEEHRVDMGSGEMVYLSSRCLCEMVDDARRYMSVSGANGLTKQ